MTDTHAIEKAVAKHFYNFVNMTEALDVARLAFACFREAKNRGVYDAGFDAFCAEHHGNVIWTYTYGPSDRETAVRVFVDVISELG